MIFEIWLLFRGMVWEFWGYFGNLYMGSCDVRGLYRGFFIFLFVLGDSVVI